jgi:hypothetical protein
MMSYFVACFQPIVQESHLWIGYNQIFLWKTPTKNVTKDVRHFDDCEQLFLTIGLCYTIEALIEFFQIASKEAHPTTNIPPLHNIHVGNNWKI